MCDETTRLEDTEDDEDDGLGECDEIVIVDEEEELGAGSASLSR